MNHTIVVLMLICLTTLPNQSNADTINESLPSTGNCFDILIGKHPPLQEYFMANSMVIRRYDRNKDGIIDTVTNTPSSNGVLAPYPLYYLRDFNQDNRPDISYTDKRGHGLCKDFTVGSPNADKQDRKSLTYLYI